MRRLTLFLLVALLVPSAALAGDTATGDGSLVVSAASARIVTVQGRGLIFGHITQGTLTVMDEASAEASGAQVSGTSMLKLPIGATVSYSGSEIRFLFPSGRFILRIEGVGIDISAVGKGAVSAIGVGTSSDGTVATNGGRALPLSLTPTTLLFGRGTGPNAVPTGKPAAH